MDARHALSIPRSDMKQLSNMGASGALSSSLPVLPQTSFEEAYPSSTAHGSQLSSNCGSIGPIFSSDMQYSSVLPQKNQSRNTPFIFQPSNNGVVSFSAPQSSHSTLLPPASSNHYAKESNASWCTDSVTDFLDIPVNIPMETSQVEGSSSSVMVPEEFGKRSDWQDWADQLINDDAALNSGWDELLVDTNITDMEPKVR